MGLKCTSIYKPSIFDPSAGLVSEFQESMCRSYVNFVSHQLLTGWVAHSRPNGCPEMTWGRTLKKALKCKGLPVNFKEWGAIAEDRSEWRSRTYSKPMPPSRIDPTGFMRVKMNIALRKRTLSPVRLVLEDSSKRSFMLFVVVSLQLGNII